MSQKVLSQIDADGNATVMLNRPEVHNAFDPEMVAALTATLRKLASDAGVRAIVITSTGVNFCAGADIEHMKKSAKFSRAQNHEAAHATATMFHTLYALEKPTIACVRGAVRGGGVGLVAACDIAIADRSATFRLTEVKLGIIPAMISPYVIAAIGRRMARRYMISGEEFDAAEAYRIGLLHDLVPDGELIASVGRMLGYLYSSGPNAVTAVKKLIPEIAGARIDEALVEQTARRIAEVRTSAEAQEGLSAFLEKRRASWVTPASEKQKKSEKNEPPRRQDAKKQSSRKSK